MLLNKLGEEGDITSVLGISGDTELDSDLEERFDAIWSELNFDAVSSVDGLQAAFSVLTEFKLDIKNPTETFLDKLEVIKVFMKVHGYRDLTEITDAEVLKLKQLYKAFTKTLPEITLQDLEKIQMFPSIESISAEQMPLFCSFMANFGISLSLPDEEFSKVKNLQGLLDNVGYRSTDWLATKETTKIMTVFPEFSIGTIANCSTTAVENFSLIMREFSIDLPSISSIELKRKISNIKKLLGSCKESTEARITTLRHIANLDSLTQLDIGRLEKLISILELNERSNTMALVEWIEEKGISINVADLTEKTFSKLTSLKSKIELATGKAFKDVEVQEIAALDVRLQALLGDDLVTTDASKLTQIKSTLTTMAKDLTGTEVSQDLAKALKVFRIDAAEKGTAYEDTKNFLKSFGIDILALSESDAEHIVSIMTIFGAEITNGLNHPEIKAILLEMISSFSYGSLLDVTTDDAIKVLTLTKVIGVDVENLEAFHIKNIKLITTILDFDIKEASQDYLEQLSRVLVAEFEGSVKRESFMSKVSGVVSDTASSMAYGVLSSVTGENVALKTKLSEIKQKIKALGYNVLDFQETDYKNTNDLLAIFGKTFATATATELTKLNDLFQSFDLEIKTWHYKVTVFANVLKALDVSPFSATTQAKDNIKVLDDIHSLTELDETEIQALKDLFTRYEIDVKSNEFQSNFTKLVESYGRLGFEDIFSISEENKAIVHSAEAVSHKTSNLEKLVSISSLISKITFEFTESQSKNVLTYVSLFKVDLGGTEQVDYKNSLVTEVKKQCKVSFASPIPEALKTSIEESITALEKHHSCKANPTDSQCAGVITTSFPTAAVKASGICNPNDEL